MKSLLLIISIFISSALIAQTKYTVIASGLTFNTALLTINQGDTVEWINQSGLHNVNGSQATFPSNPQSFNSGAVSAGWTYTFVFNSIGNHSYRCDQHFGSGMTGVITVQLGTGVNQQVTKSKEFGFYPNPASKYLYFSGYEFVNSMTIYTLTGEEVFRSNMLSEKIDVSVLSSGVYFVKVVSNENEIIKKLIIQ